MRWFKHLSGTARDEKISKLLEEAGLEGYGFWWRLLEVIAEQMTPGSAKCAVTYSLSKWSRELGCHHHTVGKYLATLEVAGLVTVNKGESTITVTITNLLKYRDEYSRKSGQSPDSVRTKS